jgi:hypothetical protein
VLMLVSEYLKELKTVGKEIQYQNKILVFPRKIGPVVATLPIDVRPKELVQAFDEVMENIDALSASIEIIDQDLMIMADSRLTE